jgi:hypothetical protein
LEEGIMRMPARRAILEAAADIGEVLIVRRRTRRADHASRVIFSSFADIGEVLVYRGCARFADEATRAYCTWGGILLAVVGAAEVYAGRIPAVPGGTALGWFHFITGTLLLVLGLTNNAVRAAAEVAGVVYILLAASPIAPWVFGPWSQLVLTSPIYSVFHLIFGLLGVWFGFGPRPSPSMRV